MANRQLREVHGCTVVCSRKLKSSKTSPLLTALPTTRLRRLARDSRTRLRPGAWLLSDVVPPDVAELISTPSSVSAAGTGRHSPRFKRFDNRYGGARVLDAVRLGPARDSSHAAHPLSTAGSADWPRRDLAGAVLVQALRECGSVWGPCRKGTVSCTDEGFATDCPRSTTSQTILASRFWNSGSKRLLGSPEQLALPAIHLKLTRRLRARLRLASCR